MTTVLFLSTLFMSPFFTKISILLYKNISAVPFFLRRKSLRCVFSVKNAKKHYEMLWRGFNFISTATNTMGEIQSNKCVNALSGFTFISTQQLKLPKMKKFIVSMPCRALPSFLQADGLYNACFFVCQCPVGLYLHFYPGKK